MCKIIDKLFNKIKLHDLKQTIQRINDVYQIAEQDGKLWLTFYGNPIVPEDLLTENIVDVLCKVRKLQIDRFTGNEGQEIKKTTQ